MQKVSLRSKVSEDSARGRDVILHFSLHDALPSGHTLALNTQFGILSYLASGDHAPHILLQEQFTHSEMSVLMPLLEMFPYFCPYEVMYSSFCNNSMSDASVARSRERLLQAQEHGVWDQEIRPIRSALSRTRLKLKAFGLDITSILATGYILMLGSSFHSMTRTPSLASGR